MLLPVLVWVTKKPPSINTEAHDLERGEFLHASIATASTIANGTCRLHDGSGEVDTHQLGGFCKYSARPNTKCASLGPPPAESATTGNATSCPSSPKATVMTRKERPPRTAQLSPCLPQHATGHYPAAHGHIVEGKGKRAEGGVKDTEQERFLPP